MISALIQVAAWLMAPYFLVIDVPELATACIFFAFGMAIEKFLQKRAERCKSR